MGRNMQIEPYDLIVIGGGPMGLSTAWNASKRGLRTLVVEQFGFFNNLGSSAGASRQFRLQYAQQYMAELALASQSFWSELQNLTRDTLVTQCGSLWFGDPALSSQEGGIQAAEDMMDALGIIYEKLNATQIEEKYFFKNLPGDYSGFFQANGGIINIKAAERAMYNAALNSGLVDFRAYQTVTRITVEADRPICVGTNQEEFIGEKLAITAGAYSNQLTRSTMGFETGIDIWEMTSAYFKKKDPLAWLPTWFVFQEPQITSLFYGFPEVDWAHPGYIRVAPDIPDYGRILTNPNERSGKPSPESLRLTSNWDRENMEGLHPEPLFTSTCMIALSHDTNKELLLDYAAASCPQNNRIVVYTAGWAAKFIPILGDTICQMLDEEITSVTYGDYTIDLDNFSIDWTYT